MLDTKRSYFRLFFSLFAVCLISYFYVLNGDFIGDDIDRIAFNIELRSYWIALTGGLRDRPLLMLVVTFISKVFGTDNFYYRVFSLLCHSWVATQIYLFFLELNKDSKSGIKNEIALFCAFGFALHPLNSQAITTAIQVSVIITAGLGLVALRSFNRGVSGTQDRNFKSSFWSLVAGILFKPNLFFMPLIFLFQHKKITAPKPKKIFILASYFLVLLIPVCFYFIGRANFQLNDVSPFKYFLVQSEVLFTYFKLMVVPYGLQFLYDFKIPADIWTSTNWIYILIHASLITLAYFKLPSRLLWTLFVCFYISFIPESSFFPINHLAFEHRTYFSLVFFFLFWGSWLALYPIEESHQRMVKIVTTAVCLVFIILNQDRNVEIKRYGTWAYHTLLKSNSNQYHNYQFSFSLARAKNFDLVEPIIRNYPVLYPGRGYEVLVDILEYYKTPAERMRYFDKFLVMLESPDTRPIAKMFLNKLIMEDFANSNNDVRELARIERAVAAQFPGLLDKNNRYVIPGIVLNYTNLAIYLTQSNLKDSFKALDPISYLRAKVYLQVYFNKNSEYLQPDIENELQKHPDNAILKDLLQLLKQEKS